MSKEELEKFEKELKNLIVSEYQNFLPKEKIDFISKNEYSNIFSNTDIKDVNILKCNFIREIMSDLINVTCELDYEVEQGVFEKLLYGRALEDGLIENYSLEIAKKLNIDFNIKPESRENLAMVLEMYRSLQFKLDYMAFNSDAVEITESSNVDDAIEYFDNLSIEEHKNGAKKASTILNNNFEISSSTKPIEGKDSFQIVYSSGKRIVKYIDNKKQEHLIKVDDSYDISNTYRKAFAYSKNSQNISADAVYDELKSQFEITDSKVKEKKDKNDKIEEIDTEEIVQIQKIKDEEDTEPKIVPAVEENKEQEMHALDEAKEKLEEEKLEEKNKEKEPIIISFSGDIDDRPIETDVKVKEEKSSIKEIPIISSDDNDDIIVDDRPELTHEQIEQLESKAKANTITIDELRDLRRALSLEANKKEKEIKEEKQQEVDLMNTIELEKLNEELQKKKENFEKLKNEKKPAKINKALLFFIFCIIISISLIIGVILAYYK